MRAALAALALAAVALAGCGGDPGELMTISTHGGAGDNHRYVVTGDGRGSCDRGADKLLPGDRVIDAREIAKDIAEQAQKAASYPVKSGTRRYILKTTDGDVRWSEGTPGLPSVLPKAQLLALQLERLLCRPS
jgi:hypothetical protein